MDIYNAALWAFEQGWNVIPVHLRKGPHNNLIRTGHYREEEGRRIPVWKPLQTQRIEREWLKEWFTPEVPGLALITGTLSGVVVLDFDGPEGQTLLSDWGLSPSALSGSGSPHVYVRHPGHHVRTIASGSLKHPPFPGLDIRADGGMAVLPPSVLSNGTYRMLNPRLLEINELPEGPAHWSHLIKPPEVTLPEIEPSEYVGHDELEGLWHEAMSRSGNGRNEAGYWLARRLKSLGLSEQEAHPWMMRFQREMPAYDARGRHSPYTPHQALASLKSAYGKAVQYRRAKPQQVSLEQRVRRIWGRLSREQQTALSQAVASACWLTQGESGAAALRGMGIPVHHLQWAKAQQDAGLTLSGWPYAERQLARFEKMLS